MGPFASGVTQVITGAPGHERAARLRSLRQNLQGLGCHRSCFLPHLPHHRLRSRKGWTAMTRECSFCGAEVVEPPAFAESQFPYVCSKSGARLLEKETVLDNFQVPSIKLD